MTLFVLRIITDAASGVSVIYYCRWIVFVINLNENLRNKPEKFFEIFIC